MQISCTFSALEYSIAHTDHGVRTWSLTDRYLDGFQTLLGGQLAHNDCPCACVLGHKWGIKTAGPEGCVSSHLRVTFHLLSTVVMPIYTPTIRLRQVPFHPICTNSWYCQPFKSLPTGWVCCFDLHFPSCP